MAYRHHPRSAVEHTPKYPRRATGLRRSRSPSGPATPGLVARPQRHRWRTWARRTRAHPITGVLEQPTAVCLDGPASYLVVCGQCRPHALGVRFPPTGRPLNIGEQKRHHPEGAAAVMALPRTIAYAPRSQGISPLRGSDPDNPGSRSRRHGLVPTVRAAAAARSRESPVRRRLARPPTW